MSDVVLERVLREGVHPDREIYIMPSKQLQFLSAPDLAALIAYLRTIPPVGEMTPLPPAGFEEAVTARLPDDYWRTLKEGEKRAYHNSAEEAAYYKANQPPDLGPEMARGRMIASSGFGHEAAQFTAAERRDVIAYTRALARSRQTSSR